MCKKSVFSCINPAICISLQYLLKALCSSFSQEASLNRNLVLPAAFKVGGISCLVCTEVVVTEYISVANSLGVFFIHLWGELCAAYGVDGITK